MVGLLPDGIQKAWVVMEDGPDRRRLPSRRQALLRSDQNVTVQPWSRACSLV